MSLSFPRYLQKTNENTVFIVQESVQQFQLQFYAQQQISINRIMNLEAKL